MKKILFLFFLIFTGCISVSHIAQTSGLNELELNSIPKGAKEVVLEKNTAPSELYEQVYSALISRGHRIAKDDKDRFYIITEGKDVGQSTLQRSTISITSDGIVSTANIKTEWKAGTDAVMGASMIAGVGITSEWTQAEWTKDRSGIAFAESVAVANRVSDGKISFR